MPTIQQSQTYATTVPVVTTSGTTAFLMNMDTLIRKACGKLGDQNPTPNRYQSAIAELNMIMADLQNTGEQLWKKHDYIVPLIANEPAYYLDPLLIDAGDWFWRLEGSDTIITPMTKTNYIEQSVKTTSGTPNRVYIDWQLQQPVAYFYPVYTYTTGFVLGTDSNSYLCTVGHTAAATNRPITGADWADYWELSSATSPNAWVTATVYDSGCVHFTGTIRNQDVNVAADDPDAPVRWNNALMWLLADGLTPEYGLQQWERQDIKQRAMMALASARAGGRESSEMRIFPEFRR